MMTKADLRRVIYVDDEPHIRMVAQLALEKVGGFVTLICSSGQELLDRAPDFAPDLLLLDVMMPGMDGPAALSALRRLPGFETMPAVFVTAKTQISEVNRLKSAGALDVILKPFRPLTLPDQIRTIWDNRAGYALSAHGGQSLRDTSIFSIQG